jgi:molecular chaperone DnaK
MGTGKEANVEIKESSGLSETEISKMQADADSHAEEDRRRFELASSRNEAEHMCYQMEKMISEHSAKLKDSDKEPLENAIAKVREKAKGDDVAAIKAAVKELEQTSHALSKAMYEHAGSAPKQGNGAGESASSPAEDDTIDAEFEVKND